MDLRERWHDLIPDAGELVSDLAGRYTDTDRRAYRDDYLVTALDTADDLVQLATDPTAVRLAVWFHRAVHGPDPDDAEASARLAADLLPRYGVGATRVAEVERLVRLTGDSPGPDPAEDPNGAVVHDAASAVLAAAPAGYRRHADTVRIEAADRDRHVAELHARIRRQLGDGVFRTPLARERLEQRARENLAAELELLDERIPAPWRGWQQAGLQTIAFFAGLTAGWLAALATRQPWHEPFDDVLPGWTAALLLLGGPVLAVALYRVAGRSDRPARSVAGACCALALVLLAGCLLRIPAVDRAHGVGLRVPLLVAAALLFCVAAGATLAAVLLRSRARRYVPARNRGQLLARLGAAAVIVLLLLCVDPLSRRYLLGANEHVTGGGTPGEPAPFSALDGHVLWRTDLHLTEGVATAHGIAVQNGSGGVSMLDGRTGEERWAYHRTDTPGNDRPTLYPLDGGARLLVDWDGFDRLVLDTASGHRVAGWDAADHETVQSADPLVTGKTVSKGSDSIRGVDTDGGTRWTYAPGRCLSISAEAAGDAVVALLDSSCSDPDQLVGLDLRTGKELWTKQTSDLPFGPIAAGAYIVVVEGAENGRSLSRLRAIDPRTGNDLWQAKAPDGSCTRRPAGGPDVLVLSCRSGQRTRYVGYEASTGRIAWQHELGFANSELTVTASGRLVYRTNERRGCRIVVADRLSTRTVDVRDPVITPDNYCRQYVQAFGDLVVVATDEGSVALR